MPPRECVCDEALDVRAGGGLECGIALRVACGGAWVVMAASVNFRRGYRCVCFVEYNLPACRNQEALRACLRVIKRAEGWRYRQSSACTAARQVLRRLLRRFSRSRWRPIWHIRQWWQRPGGRLEWLSIGRCRRRLKRQPGLRASHQRR